MARKAQGVWRASCLVAARLARGHHAAPLGFVRGLNPEQLRAIDRRGGWAAARVPTLEDAVKAGNWYCGPPEGCVEYLQRLQEKYPGLEVVSASSSMGTPQQVMVEQLEWFGKEVMPAFQTQKVQA